MRRLVEANEADVWILTETRDTLRPKLGEYVAHSTPRPITNRNMGEGSRWVSIWSRYPVQKINGALTDEERAVAALIDIGTENKLLVYGTVLPWKNDEEPGWTKHLRVIPQQCEAWLGLQKRYSNNPFCVAGDLNSDMGNGRRYGTKEGVLALKQGLAACGMYCATEPGSFPKGLLSKLPIDHIALPLNWLSKSSVFCAWPAQAGVSDHSRMIVQVNL